MPLPQIQSELFGIVFVYGCGLIMGLISTTSAILYLLLRETNKEVLMQSKGLRIFFLKETTRVLTDLDVSNCGKDAVQFEHVYIQGTTSIQVELMGQMG